VRHVDAGRIAKLRALEAGLAEELVGLFLRTAQQRMDEIVRATSRRDAPLVERLAHNMRGSCATLGMPRLAELLLALEQRAEQRRLDDAAELLDELRRELGVDIGLLRAIAGD
jgi:HPt (histidine-containing phosphotransfer) domain-containing protein